MVIAFYINRLCTINPLENFNPPVLLKPFLENSNVATKDQNKKSNFGRRNSKIIKLATLEYFILVYS